MTIDLNEKKEDGTLVIHTFETKEELKSFVIKKKKENPKFEYSVSDPDIIDAEKEI